MNTFILPKCLDESRALEFSCELNNTDPSDRMILDVSRLRWAYPFGTLVVASQIRRYINHYEPQVELVGYSELNHTHSYLSHIGFFRHLGFELGKNPGEARGSRSYMPITVLRYTDLMIDEIMGDSPMHKAIQAKADTFSSLLTQSHRSAITTPVSYCIRELVRNVFEHARIGECMLAGQQYSNGRVQIGIVDNGCGILSSLKERFDVKSDSEALSYALKPGISRSVLTDDDNQWSNSGFGLYVLSELGRRTGYFSITSGSAILRVTSTAGDTVGPACHAGTAVNIIFRKLHGTNLAEHIKQIIEEGEKQSIPGIGTPRASKSSKSV